MFGWKETVPWRLKSSKSESQVETVQQLVAQVHLATWLWLGNAQLVSPFGATQGPN